jgi:hypothetical protein
MPQGSRGSYQTTDAERAALRRRNIRQLLAQGATVQDVFETLRVAPQHQDAVRAEVRQVAADTGLKPPAERPSRPPSGRQDRFRYPVPAETPLDERLG